MRKLTSANIFRRLAPPASEWVLYQSNSLCAADLGDLKIQIVGPGRPLTQAQMDFLRQHFPTLTLWRALRFYRRRQGWIFFAHSGGVLCHYTFVMPGRAYRRMFSLIEPDAQMIGPCHTGDAFRGRGIFPRLLRYVVKALQEQGLGPFYVFAEASNTASIRGMEKAGFVRRGIWRGKRYFLDLRVVSQRVGD